MSHPVWVRGLKRNQIYHHLEQFRVAPRVGAWIETAHRFPPSAQTCVAPRVGAWIETLIRKREYRNPQVAPRVGAWIETAGRMVTYTAITSHPVWVRGLKPLGVGADVGVVRRTPCGCVD